ncbi:baseplate assembly protein [Chania multitudinisentens RB-25]|uniref:Baseplate assembly protein n=1 Tax=Chania multitudinisentens RB-25 TaxID=1441930 RepID=W0L3Z4_9GAMM|nr:baseplate assembly protein [Chania multitudinisentens]AHG18473.1 baseplate assembly protein [Chania multitudinisentens RB-25]
MSVIDLSRLPAPIVIEELSFELLFEQNKNRLIELYPEGAERQAIERTLQLESEPLVKLLQENAYRELLLRQRVNQAALAGMVAFSQLSDLDHLGANNNVERLVITPADDTAIPPVPAVMESDSDFRLRIPAAFEGMSVAGPTGAYEFHTVSADGRIADASAISPSPANVTITVLSREGDGTASDELLTIVDKALNSEKIRPVADRLLIQSANIVNYQIDAVLYLLPGPEAVPVLENAKTRLVEYINQQRRLGRDIRRSAIYAALHAEGVQRVELAAPLEDVVLDRTQAAYCADYQVVVGGTDE